MKRTLPFVLVAFVAAVTLISATVFFRAKKMSERTSLAEEESAPGDEGHRLGPENAPVTLEEFGDYQCPPCAKVSGFLNAMEKEFEPNLKIVFRNFPLPVHMHARQAALVAEAAGLQGKFWEMHDLLYMQQSEWSVAPEVDTFFNRYAGMIGLDLARFKRDVESNEVRERVASDQKMGLSAGVENTPAIFVNRHVVPPPALNPAGLRSAVEAAIKNPSAH